MYDQEAKHLIDEKLKAFSQMSYSQRQDLIREGHLTEEAKSSTGVEYQLDAHAFYDDKPQKTIRVSVAIFRVKEAAPWWQPWKNIDKAVANDDNKG